MSQQLHWEPAAAAVMVGGAGEQQPYLHLPAILRSVASGQRGVHGGGLALLLGLDGTFWSIGQT